MRFLLYSLVCLSLCQCASDYRHLTRSLPDDTCANQIKPVHKTALYSAGIDIVGNHISALLFIKVMPDSSYRVVFTNEAGVTFLDMGFLRDGTVKVYTVVKQLDRRAVINTLRKDFELILGLPFKSRQFARYTNGDEVYYAVGQKKERAYFITNKDCAYLQRLERGSKRKRVVSVAVSRHGYPEPEKIEVTHHTFNMQIKLTRIQRE